MSMKITETTRAATAFKIGAVSRITNIPVDTLRIWERRYSVVEPIRSNNADRLYQRGDINRLTLLKMLVDRGHSIGSIANLSNVELVERLHLHDENNSRIKNNQTSRKNKSGSRVVVIGDVLSLQLSHHQSDNELFTIDGLYNTEEEFYKSNDDKPIDILVVEYPTVQEEQISEIDQLYKQSGAKNIILVYGFTNSAAKRLLSSSRYHLVPAPVTVEHLRTEINQLSEHPQTKTQITQLTSIESPAPRRHYTNKELIQLSSLSSTIKCECPQHLSTLILKLVQFEIYSEQCENRGLKDAELHAQLGKMTGHARAIMEEALTEVVKAEGLKV